MTTINPVPMTQPQAPAFRGKTTKAQQKFVDTVNKAIRENNFREMMKTDPERAKVMLMNEVSALSFIEFAKKYAQGFVEKFAKRKP